MEWTRHVLLNIEPKLNVKPDIRIQARAVQIYGKARVLKMDSVLNFAALCVQISYLVM